MTWSSNVRSMPPYSRGQLGPAMSYSTAVAQYARCHANRAPLPFGGGPGWCSAKRALSWSRKPFPTQENSTLFSVGTRLDSLDLGFWRIAAADPERTAIVDADGRRQSYGELLDESRAIARAAHALGMRRGDALAVVLPNHRSFLACWLATAEAGLYFVP